MHDEKKTPWAEYRSEFGRRTLIMGILNATPDSFSDGGRFDQIDRALAHIEQMVRDGADIIDIGGESSRPFSEPVSVEDEIQRVVPIIEIITRKFDVPISIDTTKAPVAEQALAAGASIINDISALRTDPAMTEVAARHNVPVILMHMQNTPKTMQMSPSYDDLLGEIYQFLEAAVNKAVRSGIKQSNLIIDPGIGFGKTFQHNLELIQGLGYFKKMGVPILIGPSRKAFIRHLLKKEGQEDFSPMHPQVETGTQAAVTASILNGADIVRVHDVAGTFATVKIADALKHACQYSTK